MKKPVDEVVDRDQSKDDETEKREGLRKGDVAMILTREGTTSGRKCRSGQLRNRRERERERKGELRKRAESSLTDRAREL